MSQMQMSREEAPIPLASSLEADSSMLSNDINVLTAEMMRLQHNPDEYWYTIGSRLLQIVNGKLYREGGYHSFSNYCRAVLGYSRQHAYKLIKVVEFIKRVQAQATTPDAQQRIVRLSRLGFTKLYMLQALPATKLAKILDNGFEVAMPDGTVVHVPIEELKIGQLKSVLATEPSEWQSFSTLNNCANEFLLKQIMAQAHNLAQLAANCRQELAAVNDSVAVNEKLALIEQGAETIARRLSALTIADD